MNDTESAAMPSVCVRLGCGGVLVSGEGDRADNFSSIIPTLVSSPLLSNIRSLSIRNDGRDTQCPRDLSVLSPLHLVEELTYVDSNHAHLLNMLSKRTPDGTALLMFPSLTTLTLHQPVWQQFKMRGGHSPLLGQDIDDMLDERKLLGVPLQELYLRELMNVKPEPDYFWLTIPRNDLRVFVMCRQCDMEGGGRSDADRDEDLINVSRGYSEGWWSRKE